MPQTAERPTESTKCRPALRGNPAEIVAIELEFDPLEDLCCLAEAYRKEHGLTADEAIERILTKIRSC